VDAGCYYSGHCYIRLAGSEQAVRHAQKQLGGEALEKSASFWQALREHQLSFFQSSKPLYRVLVKPATPPLPMEGSWLLDWGGAQRWLVSDEPVAVIRESVAAAGGHVSQFRAATQGQEVFEPLPAPLLNVHQRLKNSFDPHRIFNPGRMYPGL